jgi:hypothetical protein
MEAQMGQHPKTANMTASEVLSWIAFGATSTREALAEASHQRLER